MYSSSALACQRWGRSNKKLVKVFTIVKTLNGASRGEQWWYDNIYLPETTGAGLLWNDTPPTLFLITDIPT